MLFHFRCLVGINSLGVPNIQVPCVINGCIIKFAKLDEGKIIGKVLDKFGSEILELEDGIRTSLVVAIAPDVSIILFGFLCTEVSLGCEESTSE